MFIFKHGNILGRVIRLGGPAFTRGYPVLLKLNGKAHMYWPSQRQAAKAMNVSANVMSKYLSGKLKALH